MLARFKEIEDLRSKVIFQSIIYGNESISEFEKFDSMDLVDPHHIKERELLYTILEQIRHRGAKEYYFKPEGPAKALPKVKEIIKQENKNDFGLRLYCILVNENLLILLNGGIKTKKDPHQCPNVKDHFKKALKIADKLNKAIREGFVLITENGLVVEEGYDFDI